MNSTNESKTIPTIIICVNPGSDVSFDLHSEPGS